MTILVYYSAENYIRQNVDRAKEFTVRMSGGDIVSAQVLFILFKV